MWFDSTFLIVTLAMTLGVLALIIVGGGKIVRFAARMVGLILRRDVPALPERRENPIQDYGVHALRSAWLQRLIKRKCRSSPDDWVIAIGRHDRSLIDDWPAHQGTGGKLYGRNVAYWGDSDTTLVSPLDPGLTTGVERDGGVVQH